MTSTWASQYEGTWTHVPNDAKIKPSDCERGGKIDKLGVPTPIQYLQKVVMTDDGEMPETVTVRFSKTEKATVPKYHKHVSLEAAVNHIRIFENCDEKLEYSTDWTSWSVVYNDLKAKLHTIGEEPAEEGEAEPDLGAEEETRDEDGEEVTKSVREWIKEDMVEAKDELK